MFGWPLCQAPRGSGTRERRVRLDDGSGCGAALSLLQAGRGGPGRAAPARWMWEEVVGVLFVSDATGF